MVDRIFNATKTHMQYSAMWNACETNMLNSKLN